MGWYIWTAVLAAMPHGVWSFGPMVPGQIGLMTFSLAVMLFLTVSSLVPCLGEGYRSVVARAHVVLVRAGWVATAGLAVAEAYAFARGYDGLVTAEQITLNEVMSLVEFACAGAAVFCWAASSLGDGNQKGAPSREAVTASFMLGSLWPTACVLMAGLLKTGSPWPPPFLCLAVFAVALACGVRCHRDGGTAWDVTALLSGHMAFLAFRSFVGEYRMDILDAGLADASFFGFFCVFISLLSVALLLYVRWDERGPKRVARVSSRGDCPEAGEGAAPAPAERTKRRMEQRLAEASRSPLTEREATVLARTALGATATSIASDLGLSPASVATYRHRGYEKLGIGGARELRRIAATFDLTEKQPARAGSRDLAEEGAPGRKPGSFAPQAIAFACIVPALLLNATNNVQVGGQWYHRGTSYITWSAALVLSLVSFLRTVAHCRGASPPCSEQGPLVRAAGTVISLVLVVLLSFGAFCGWSGMWLYKVWGPALLFVASLAVGRARVPRRGRALPLWRVLLTGFEALFCMPPLALLASAGIAIAYHLELYYVGMVTDWIFILFPSLIFLGVVVLVYQARVAAVPIVEPTDKELDRVSHYLRGRGIDGLRLCVVLDLACGYGVLEVCQRRCTTLATVKSYRQRTYDDLGVHSMRDLRKLLSQEAKVTSLERMHPQK